MARRGDEAVGVRLLLVGAGGHAGTVVDLVQKCGHQVSAYVDPAQSERRWLGQATRLDGPDESVLADERLAQLVDGVVMGIGGVRPEHLAVRLRLFDRYAAAFLEAPPALVHPAAALAGRAAISPGATIMAGAIVNAAAAIGRAAVVNSGAIVEHDAVIGEGAHVAPGAIVLGGAMIGASAMIGAGAVVLPGARVPAAALVPALTRFGGA
jgi:sugar O-acyltransferase (sialic acid O-acetyltransferase NeuD family)